MPTVDVLPYWNDVRKGLFAALDRLTDEQLGFVPREPLWSLGTVACHMADTEEGWLRIAAGTFEGWPPYHIERLPHRRRSQGPAGGGARAHAGAAGRLDDADLDVQVTAPWGHPHRGVGSSGMSWSTRSTTAARSF